MKNFTRLLSVLCLLGVAQISFAQCDGAIEIATCGMTQANELLQPLSSACFTGPDDPTPTCADAGMVTEFFIVDLNDILDTPDDPDTPEDESTSGPRIVCSSTTGIISPEDCGFDEGSCMGIVPVCYNLSAVQGLVDALNDGSACCAIVNAVIDDVCTNIVAEFTEGSQVENLDDLLTVFAAFGTTELSVEFFASVADGVNANFTGGFTSLDNFCAGTSAIGYCTDQANRTEYSITACPLSIELASLEATNTGKGNELKWKTATEVDNDYFIVERSYDGQTYEEIGMIEAAGNSSLVNDYKFNDEKVVGRINYYRIVAVSYADAKQFSNVVAVETKASTLLDAVNIAPNPVRSVFAVSFDSDINGSANVIIVDATGKKVVDKNVEVVFGYNQLEEQLGDLNNGLYMLIIQIGDNVASEKFMKL